MIGTARQADRKQRADQLKVGNLGVLRFGPPRRFHHRPSRAPADRQAACRFHVITATLYSLKSLGNMLLEVLVDYSSTEVCTSEIDSTPVLVRSEVFVRAVCVNTTEANSGPLSK